MTRLDEPIPPPPFTLSTLRQAIPRARWWLPEEAALSAHVGIPKDAPMTRRTALLLSLAAVGLTAGQAAACCSRPAPVIVCPPPAPQCCPGVIITPSPDPVVTPSPDPVIVTRSDEDMLKELTEKKLIDDGQMKTWATATSEQRKEMYVTLMKQPVTPEPSPETPEQKKANAAWLAEMQAADKDNFASKAYVAYWAGATQEQKKTDYGEFKQKETDSAKWLTEMQAADKENYATKVFIDYWKKIDYDTRKKEYTDSKKDK